MSPELQWFATLLYCGLDPKQPLVKATMRMIDAEWDKMREQKDIYAHVIYLYRADRKKTKEAA